MVYNLTERQKEVARQLLQLVRDGRIPETFSANWSAQYLMVGTQGEGFNFRALGLENFDTAVAEALIQAKLLIVDGFGKKYTLTGLASKAVDTNFAEDETRPVLSSIAQPHPPEISLSLDRLREKYPDSKKLGFLIMRFAAEKPYGKIVDAIKQTGEKHGLKIVRADETEFHADLWGNVRTYLHGCSFGIAVYERIQTDEPNANVGLEVGYLLAMNKPVLLLKDKSAETTQSDLAGKLYKTFDPHDADGTIPDQLTKWLEDYGIIVPKRE